MPYVPAVPPADRFFARLDAFECECPSCGKLIFSSLHKRKLSVQLQQVAHLRQRARDSPKAKRVWQAVWNPYSQRLACPWCGRSFVAGLVLYPIRPHAPRPLDAPPDTIIPSLREYISQRRQAGGWYTRQLHRIGQDVNLGLTAPCSCPEHGWSVTCPVHGDPDQGAKVEGGSD